MKKWQVWLDMEGRMAKVLAAILSVVAMASVIGCQAAAATQQSRDLVPEGVDFIGQVQLGRILNDPGIKELYDIAPKGTDQPATFDAALAKVFTETGVDVAQFSTLTVFGSASQDGSYGIIAEGSFVRADLIQAMQQAPKVMVSTAEYSGHELHLISFEGDSHFSGEAALTFLNDETLVFGYPPIVRQVIDVFVGDREPASGSVVDTYNSLDGSLARLALSVPANALSQLDKIPFELPVSIQAFTDIRVVAIEVDKSEDQITATVSMEFATEDSSMRAGDTIDGLLKLARGFIPDEAIRDLLSGVAVATVGKVVKLDFAISMDQALEMIKNQPDLNLSDILGNALQ